MSWVQGIRLGRRIADWLGGLGYEKDPGRWGELEEAPTLPSDDRVDVPPNTAPAVVISGVDLSKQPAMLYLTADQPANIVAHGLRVYGERWGVTSVAVEPCGGNRVKCIFQYRGGG